MILQYVRVLQYFFENALARQESYLDKYGKILKSQACTLWCEIP